MPNELKLPEDAKLASKIIQSNAERATRRDEMGWIGLLFGGATQKAGNVASFAIVFSCIMLAIIVLRPTSSAVPVGELYTLFGGIITLALGYMFGKGANS